jgi:hypothetical protein
MVLIVAIIPLKNTIKIALERVTNIIFAESTLRFGLDNNKGHRMKNMGNGIKMAHQKAFGSFFKRLSIPDMIQFIGFVYWYSQILWQYQKMTCPK